MEGSVEKQEGNKDSREEALKTIASILTDLNTRAQLEVAIATLGFLKQIENKTPDDRDKIKNQELLIANLESDAYKSKLESVFVEKFALLGDKSLIRYLDTLLFEEEVAEVNLQVSIALMEVQDELTGPSLSSETIH